MLSNRQLRNALNQLSEDQLDMPATIWDVSTDERQFIDFVDKVPEPEFFTDRLPVLGIKMDKFVRSDDAVASAIVIGSNPVYLANFLEEAVSALDFKIRSEFKSSYFDFAGKRLISATKTNWILQWAARKPVNAKEPKKGVTYFGIPEMGYVCFIQCGEAQYLTDNPVMPLYLPCEGGTVSPEKFHPFLEQ